MFFFINNILSIFFSKNYVESVFQYSCNEHRDRPSWFILQFCTCNFHSIILRPSKQTSLYIQKIISPLSRLSHWLGPKYLLIILWITTNWRYINWIIYRKKYFERNGLRCFFEKWFERHNYNSKRKCLNSSACHAMDDIITLGPLSNRYMYKYSLQSISSSQFLLPTTIIN